MSDDLKEIQQLRFDNKMENMRFALESRRLFYEIESAGLKYRLKKVIDITDVNDKPIASIFWDDKYIQFHDEFTQIGIDIPVLKRLIDSGYNHNHS